MKKHRRSNAPHHHKPAQSQATVVRVEGLSFSYSNRTALRSISLEAFDGEILGILGPNGSGKSTLFQILATLLVPSQGSVEIAGVDVIARPQDARRQLGVVFQSAGLDVKLTLQENLRFQGHFYGLRGEFLESRIKLLLETFGLWERKNERVEVLSGGLQRRTELAKGLLHQPRVLLLDEPSTGLDPSARRDFWDYLRESRRQFPMTVLLTTHLLDEAEKCDRVAIVDQGQIVISGKPADLRRGIGGNVLTIRSSNATLLQRKIRKQFGLVGTIIDGEVHLELHESVRLVPGIANAYPALVEELTVRKPSLEDVFLQKTGHRLESSTSASKEAKG